MTNFLQDDAGNNSSMRLMTLIWAFAILVVWVCVCFYQRAMVDIPVGVGGVLVGILFSKAVQKFGEAKPNASDSN